MPPVTTELGIKSKIEFDASDIRKAGELLRSAVNDAIKSYEAKPNKELEENIEKLREYLALSNEIEAKLSEVASQSMASPAWNRAMEDYENAMLRWEEFSQMRSEVPEGSEEWNNYTSVIEHWASEAEKAIETMDRLQESGQAVIDGTHSEEFAQLTGQLETVNDAMSLLKDDTEALATELEHVEAEAEQADFAEQIEKKAAASEKALNQLGKGLKVTALALAQLGKKVISAGFNKISSSLKGLGRDAETAAKKAKRLTLAFAKAMLGVRGLYMLFRKLRSAVMEGIKNIQEFDKENNEFAKSMENLKANTSFMKNAFGAAFAPLIQLVVPYLNMATQAIGNFMNAVGAFFSMLLGKSTFIAAKSQVDEYGNAINKAAGAQKKLNAELYGFDTLNRQQDKSGSGTDVSNMFEERNVSDFLNQGVKDFISTLKELWNNKDYFNFGKVIAEGLTEGIKGIDQAILTAKPKIIEGAKSLAEGVNGFIEGFGWKDFGTTFADGLNTILEAENAFLDEFDALGLGEGVGDSIVSFFQGTKWDELGTNAALKINNLFSVIEGIVTNEELFPSLKQAVQDTFDGFFDTIEPEHEANTIRGVFDGIANVLADTDWDNFFDIALSGLLGVADWLFDLIGNISWDKVGEALIGVLVSLIDLIFSPMTYIKILAHIDIWILNLLSAVVSFIMGSISKLFERIITLLTDLGFDTIAGFFQGMKDTWDIAIEAIKKWFKNMIQSIKDIFGINSPSKVFGDIGGFIIEGFKQGIEDMWNKVKTGLFNTFDSLKTKVKDIFGISSPSKVFEEYGKFIDLGFAEGIEGDKSVVARAMDDMVSGMEASATFAPNFGRISNFSNIPIPALATGGVVPPNAYGGYGTGGSDNGLISKIQELIDRLDGGASPVEVHAHLELDGREIYDTVVTQNNNQLQRTGTSRIRV